MLTLELILSLSSLALSEAIPNNWERKFAVGNDMSARVRSVTGARYRTGGSFNLLGGTSGTSADFAAQVFDLPLSYVINAPPAGEFGWDVEVWRIHPIVDQIFAAVDDMARHIIFAPANN